MAAPLDTESVDVVVSQEALLHIPDRGRALGEAFPCSGRRAVGSLFTDWVAHQSLDPEDKDLLWEGQAVQALESPASHRDLLTSSSDLTSARSSILPPELGDHPEGPPCRMYRRLREETWSVQVHPRGHDAFYRSYVRLR